MEFSGKNDGENGVCFGWIKVVMNCVKSVSYQVKVNKTLHDGFLPERGIRQGDPKSSYMFILCAEGLSALLRHAEEESTIEGYNFVRVHLRSIIFSSQMIH